MSNSHIVRIGHITPSSNIMLEPLTYQMNESLTGRVTHHFTRIPVFHIALSESTEAQFRMEPMLAAAQFLADAPLDAIVWNGTSASWRGIEFDQTLIAAITQETGLPASTSTIAFYNAFRDFGITSVGLALPYNTDISSQIVAEYSRQGFHITGNASLELSVNREIGALEPDAIRNILRLAAIGSPDCIAVVCTNLNATELIVEMEEELGIMIIDSIAVTFREGLRIAGVEPNVPGWGRMLAARRF